MKKDKFLELWNSNIQPWLSSSFFYNGETYIVKDCCKVKDESVDNVFIKYEKIKQITKDCYFKQNDKNCHLSRYKRAAVLIYAVLLSDPLDYNNEYKGKFDRLLLKQRLAFRLALCSIIQDYPCDLVKDKIKKCNKPVFDFKYLNNSAVKGDDFLLSIYKDLFYAEIFENYNVLTMANLLGVITEYSLLHEIEPIKDRNL